ncbi:MAG: hypothetical protein LT105_02960 [Lentimicrobium sp.]|nr:hypothetical protein [Lentimicrobium sp.]
MMKILRNIIYLAYFFLRTNYADLKASISCVRKKGYSLFRLIFDMVLSSLKYGSSFVDYFNFRFYLKDNNARRAYATMGFMYRFHRHVNDQKEIQEIDSKIKFANNFKEFANKSYIFSKDQISELKAHLNKKLNQRVVIKDPDSTGGKGVRIVEVTNGAENTIMLGDVTFDKFIEEELSNRNSIYIEDFVVQHDQLSRISPSSVNTLRVITMINDANEVDIIGSVFRIGVNCSVDNYSAGNLAAEIDPINGVVITGGIRKRSSCDEYHDIHPVTKEKILGFQIPFWEEAISMVKIAAKRYPPVRTVGWDIAITENGPVFIEGNSSWNKDTWQIPAGYGKKRMIDKYMK